MYIRYFLSYYLTTDVVFSVTTAAMNKWTRHKTLDNRITTSGLARAFDVGPRGIHDCLTSCSQDASCVSAFYILKLAKCAMEDHVVDHLEELTFRQGSTYFINAHIENAIAASTTSVPPAPISIAATNAPVSTINTPVATTTMPIVTTTRTVATTTTPVTTTTPSAATMTTPTIETTTRPVITTTLPVVTTTRPDVTTTIRIATTTQSITTTAPPVVTTTPPVAVFTCPDSREVWHFARLSDESSVTYTLIKNLATQTIANQECTDTSGHLLTIVTQARFDYFTQLMMTCPDINPLPHGVSVWIDGSNSQAGNKAAVNAYRTVSGEIMFTNSGFWAPNRPSDPYVENCVRLDHQHEYYMNDCECYKDMWYFCEL